MLFKLNCHSGALHSLLVSAGIRSQYDSTKEISFVVQLLLYFTVSHIQVQTPHLAYNSPNPIIRGKGLRNGSSKGMAYSLLSILVSHPVLASTSQLI
ncbi:hypothetical protein ACU8KH_01444 [Lachancea thermotolerans]